MGRLFIIGARRISRGFCSISSNRISVCIVGSGPAGFYTAEKMLKAYERAEIDIIDRLPTPFGLIRSGVAPDHQETKIVANQFSRVAKNERCTFFGNITLGSDISLSELREYYDIVVLSYGAESDRSLGIPGEELEGIYSAREFVWWYNGHPDSFKMAPDLKSTQTAVILGLGNVALDVARILLRPISELSKTDISDHALAFLQESSIRNVYLVARRGPAQAACTAKELREILGMKNLLVKIQEVDLDISPYDKEALKNNRVHKRVYELLSKAAASPHCQSSQQQRELHFVFFRKPEKFLPSENLCAVGAVRLEKTTLKENGNSGKQLAVGTGEFEDINCGLVLKSIGYKSLPIDGLPFDYNKGVVPNVKGRVVSSDQTEQEVVEHGLYVAGWLKRGPTGIVATNLYCAEETVSSISEDLEKGLLKAAPGTSKPGRKGLLQLLENNNIKFVPYSGWEKIDAKEKMLGEQKNKPREKITSWQKLLETSGSYDPMADSDSRFKQNQNLGRIGRIADPTRRIGRSYRSSVFFLLKSVPHARAPGLPGSQRLRNPSTNPRLGGKVLVRRKQRCGDLPVIAKATAWGWADDCGGDWNISSGFLPFLSFGRLLPTV